MLMSDTLELVDVDKLPNRWTAEDPAYLPGKLYRETTGRTIHVCPCGCESLVSIPTDSSGRESWAIKLNPGDGTVTLTPSILNRKCGAHYFIRDGKVDWCSDTGQPR